MNAHRQTATIGIDNGSTGSIGIIIGNVVSHFGPIPTRPCLHYGKKGSISMRLDREALKTIILDHAKYQTEIVPIMRAFVERPFTGKFINAVIPAHRFFEATIITLEEMSIGYEVVDSSEWQHNVLGTIKGSAKLKTASKLRGLQLYPDFAAPIRAQKDADGLLIAHHYHYRHHAP